MTIVVFGSTLSPFVRKVVVILAEKKVPYEIEETNPRAAPQEFYEISPLKKIPVIRDTEKVQPNTLADSSVICDYIENRYPEPRLYPQDLFERARALWFEEYADSIMAENVLGGLFFERVVKKLTGQITDETVCAVTLAERLPRLFDYLEKEIDEREFLVGKSFSIADASIGAVLVNFVHAGELLSPVRWPRFASYVDRIHSRPSFEHLINAERLIVRQICGGL